MLYYSSKLHEGQIRGLNKSIANKTTKEVLRKNAEIITDWLQNKPNENRLTLVCPHKRPIGLGTAIEPKIYVDNITETLSVLIRDKKSIHPISILTVVSNNDEAEINILKAKNAK